MGHKKARKEIFLRIIEQELKEEKAKRTYIHLKRFILLKMRSGTVLI